MVWQKTHSIASNSVSELYPTLCTLSEIRVDGANHWAFMVKYGNIRGMVGRFQNHYSVYSSTVDQYFTST